MSTATETQHQLSAALHEITERAGPIDRAQADPVEDLRRLAAAVDLFDVDATALPEAVSTIEDVSRHSLAVGFLAWAQRMTGEYLATKPHSPYLAERRSDVARVHRRGVSAMAGGQRQAVGLDPTPITATPDEAGGYRVTGTVAWASNVDPGAVVVLTANLPDGGTRVLAVDASEISFRPAPPLLALDATASGALTLEDVPVPAQAVIAEDLLACLAGIRPRFLLLQGAFCSGVAAESLDQAGGRLTGTAELYGPDHAALTDRYTSARERLHSFAATEASEPGTLPLPQLLELRLELAALATNCSRLSLDVEGGRGYAVASAANRRFREAAFLPVQSPSESQLRWELARAREGQR